MKGNGECKFERESGVMNGRATEVVAMFLRERVFTEVVEYREIFSRQMLACFNIRMFTNGL